MASLRVRTPASLFLALGLLAIAAASSGDGEQCTADSCPKDPTLGTSWLQVASKITQMEERPAHGASEATQTAEKAKWGVNPAAFENSMTMTASVTIDGALQRSGELAAFFTDGEVHGVTTSPAKIPFARPQKGQQLFPLTIYGHGGGSVSFKFKSAADGKVIDLAETLPFVSDATHGHAEEPLSLTGSERAASAPTWSFDYAEWEHSMTITSSVTINGVHQNAGKLGAFGPDGTCRGIAGPLLVPFGPYQGKNLFPLMTYANDGGETLSFKFEAPGGVVTDLAETMTFVVDGNKGDAIDPIHFSGPAPDLPACVDTYAGEWDPGFNCEIGKDWWLCASEPAFMEAICKKTCDMC